MKSIDYISIVLENCEVFDVPIKQVHWLYLRDIKKTLTYSENSLSEYLSASFVRVDLKMEGLTKILSSFYNMIDFPKEPDKKGYTLPVRIRDEGDITHIDVRYTDGTNEYISVPWAGERDYWNDLQRVTKDERVEIKDKIFTIRIGNPELNE